MHQGFFRSLFCFGEGAGMPSWWRWYMFKASTQITSKNYPKYWYYGEFNYLKNLYSSKGLFPWCWFPDQMWKIPVNGWCFHISVWPVRLGVSCIFQEVQLELTCHLVFDYWIGLKMRSCEEAEGDYGLSLEFKSQLVCSNQARMLIGFRVITGNIKLGFMCSLPFWEGETYSMIA